ncbi:MAG: Rieske 2Fe-2S domain-containing protein [Halieaceae bacterium]|nr:Rieske 2Fe-2S domain-containing protein [Halieaceae bacterium]
MESKNHNTGLPPFPEGWFFIGTRKSILARQLIQKTWMGQEVVIWCDQKGRICVSDAFCPHLGSHLGPEAGGKVLDGCLTCPFHGFQYDSNGQCVATPYAPPPVNARLKVYETREILGLVFAWWGRGDRKSQWSLPDAPPAGEEWSQMGFRTLQFAGHPQETTENSVDLAHLRYVHGYDNVHQVGPVSVDGPYLKSFFDFLRVRTYAAGLITLRHDISAKTHVYGLGYSFVDIHEKSIGMDSRLWVLATPVDSKKTELTLVGQTREIRKPKRFIHGLGFLPVSWRASLINHIFLTMEKLDVLQDTGIWSRKQYRDKPRLSRSDGEIAAYRRYCRQFYSDTIPETGSQPRELRSKWG